MLPVIRTVHPFGSLSREFDRIQKFLANYVKTLKPSPQLARNES